MDFRFKLFFFWYRVKLEMSLLLPEVADNLIAGVFSEELFLQDEFLLNYSYRMSS